MSTTDGLHGTGPVQGWYQDPQGTGLRWWDGQQWTTHTSQQAAAAFAPAVTTPAASGYGTAPAYGTAGGAQQFGAQPYGAPQGISPYGAPTGVGAPGFTGVKPKNTEATIGLVLGLALAAVGFFTGYYIGSFFAIAISVAGLRKASSLREQGYPPVGRARAIWGIVIGGIMLGVVIALKISHAS